MAAILVQCVIGKLRHPHELTRLGAPKPEAIVEKRGADSHCHRQIGGGDDRAEQPGVESRISRINLRHRAALRQKFDAFGEDLQQPSQIGSGRRQDIEGDEETRRLPDCCHAGLMNAVERLTTFESFIERIRLRRRRRVCQPNVWREADGAACDAQA